MLGSFALQILIVDVPTAAIWHLFVYAHGYTVIRTLYALACLHCSNIKKLIIDM